jgi:8-oxo-dGTP pyrophosphatase MutT (NUDIX family)
MVKLINMNKQIVLNERHMAASTILITKQEPKKVLLLFHKKYNLWIQPGGHVEKFENPLETAIRETKEETGIDVSFLLEKVVKIDSANVLPVPDFFLEEFVPPHEENPAHRHVDILYVVTVDEQDVSHGENEFHEIGWFTLEEALKLPMYDNTKMMLKKVFEN